jgi:hypothetical protein
MRNVPKWQRLSSASEVYLAMSWEQITAVASVGSACILAVASTAAIVQLRHARNANRLTAYLMLFDRSNSPEMIAARLHLQKLQLTEPGAVERALDDPQVQMVGNQIQATCEVVRVTAVPDELLYPLIAFAVRFWPKLAPIARLSRERTGIPVWIDVQYYASIWESRDYTKRRLRTYPTELREEIEAEMAASK